VVVFTALLLGACGGSGSGAGDDGVTISGGVVYRALGCAHGAENDTADKTVIVKDGEGSTLGTDTTGTGDCSEFGSGSEITSEYEVQVPRADFYEISVEGIPGSLTRSYDQLEKDGFTVDLDIGSSY
jgi:hypothetical protein